MMYVATAAISLSISFTLSLALLKKYEAAEQKRLIAIYRLIETLSDRIGKQT